MTLQEISNPPAATTTNGHDSLPACRKLVAGAATAIAREPNRMGAWRLVGSMLEARKAFQSHIALSRSPQGPLLHLAEGSPRLHAYLRKLFAEHGKILARFDNLIATANREKADHPGPANKLRASAAHCNAALAAYERRFHEVVFEWSHRDLGGEAG